MPTPREDVDRAGDLGEGRRNSMKAKIRRKKEGPRKQEDSLGRYSGNNLETVSVQTYRMIDTLKAMEKMRWRSLKDITKGKVDHANSLFVSLIFNF